MGSFEDSNCLSMTDSLSVYERYLRSFSVVDHFKEDDNNQGTENCEFDASCDGNVNIDLSGNENKELVAQSHCSLINSAAENIEKDLPVGLDIDVRIKADESNLCPSPALSTEYSSATADHSLTEKSNPTDVPVSSEESKSESIKQPIFITSTMENSNNAVDSVPLFRNVRPSESVFKLPISELSFNGTIKHVQKLKPIVDPITALTSNAGLVLDQKSNDHTLEPPDKSGDLNTDFKASSSLVESELDARNTSSEKDTSSSCDINKVDKVYESTCDSQCDDERPKNDDGSSRWNEQSYSSLEASFDSGVRSPDIFSEEEAAEPAPASEPFWSFIKDFETYDRKRVRKIEETLQGVPPPPSVTTSKMDVTDMLKKYYCFLPVFNGEKITPKKNLVTPTKRVSFIQSPTDSSESVKDKDLLDITLKTIKTEGSSSRDNSKTCLDTSLDKSIELKIGTEGEAKELDWPNVLKCRYYDVYYNTTKYSEKFELLSLRYGERYVGAETDCTVSVYSACCQSPSSANKRKAFRQKLAQGKSPGRRLSHLARRRQAFCSAATIGEKAYASNSKMVLIDRKKFINSNERKSPRLRRTPGKKTPSRKTPGKKTPAKTPRSGSTKKRAMRRLLMDSENVTKSQPRESMIKRALFISPENRKHPSQPSTSSVPAKAIKSRRSLFGSPALAETKSMDGTQSDVFLKRKRDLLDDEPDLQRTKIAKSLSFGGDNIGGSSSSMAISRRASEVFADRNPFELNETHKKKLLWAVSEALRVHGWRMSSPGFREKASALARLTRRLLTLTPHAARFAAPTLSTSDTMLKLARQYVFAIIQGRSVDECFQEEQTRLANEANSKLTGYISAAAYQQLKMKQSTNTFTSQIKENCNEGIVKQEQPRSTSKNILQDKLVNIESNSNSNSGSNSGLSVFDKSALFKSNSMPSFEEAAKLRARRQISFDNVDFPKR